MVRVRISSSPTRVAFRCSGTRYPSKNGLFSAPYDPHREANKQRSQSSDRGCPTAPDQARELEQRYWYCLDLAAQRFGVVVHAGCLMSTHSHEVVTDVRGVLPRFLQEFHRPLALTTKALPGWPGEVFDKRSTGQHALLTPEATIESLAYLIANPVEAGAVRYAKDWPGAHTLPRDGGAPPTDAHRAAARLRHRARPSAYRRSRRGVRASAPYARRTRLTPSSGVNVGGTFPAAPTGAFRRYCAARRSSKSSM